MRPAAANPYRQRLHTRRRTSPWTVRAPARIVAGRGAGVNEKGERSP
jgi:hypothetical protein